MHLLQFLSPLPEYQHYLWNRTMKMLLFQLFLIPLEVQILSVLRSHRIHNLLLPAHF